MGSALIMGKGIAVLTVGHIECCAPMITGLCKYIFQKGNYSPVTIVSDEEGWEYVESLA